MDTSLSKRIKYHKTSVNSRNEYREYFVFQKGDFFIMECIDWKIKDITRSGGSRIYYQEFQDKINAIAKFNELLITWEN